MNHQDGTTRASSRRLSQRFDVLHALALPRCLCTGASGVRFVLFVVSGLLLASPAAASQELQLIPDLRMLAILVVVFGVLIIPVNALLFKPLFSVIDERDQKIRGARERADELEAQAAASLAEYRSAIDRARSETDRARRESLDEARSEQALVLAGVRSDVERELDRARAELTSSRQQAGATLQDTSHDLARAAAEQILGRRL